MGKITYPKRDFDGDAVERAYLIGLRLGDLTVKMVSEGGYGQTISVHCRTTKKEQIQLFERLFAPYGYIYKAKPDKRGAVGLTCYLNMSFNFLLPKEDMVEEWIQANAKCSAAFAAGYTDAEGSFHTYSASSGHYDKAVFALASQDKNIIHWFHSWLMSIGAICPKPKLAIRKGTKREFSLHKDYWILQIHRKDSLLKLIEVFTPLIKHPKRRADMANVKANIEERNRRFGKGERKPPSLNVPKATIERLPLYLRTLSLLAAYGRKITTSDELGQRLGISPSSVRRELSYFGRFGKGRIGYEIEHLQEQLKRILSEVE